MFADVSALHLSLLEKDPSDFVSHFLFEPVPFIFGDDLATWIYWKTTLAGTLGVDPRDVVLIGSSAIGFSLSPHKSFRRFDLTSDVDCGVIIPYHFEISWRYLWQIRPSWLSLPPLSRNAIEDHRKNLVFAGTIATDRILSLLPFGKEWQDALDRMAKIPPTQNRMINLRIYKDYDALRSYQAHNLRNMRSVVATLSRSEVAEIGVEE